MIRSRTLNRRLGLLASALMLAPQGAFANPLGGQVPVGGGQATIQGQGTSTVTVNQGSQNVIINWNTFNIGAGELTQFNQPNASAIALNRVVGGLGPSQIDGKLTANGQIFLVNPYGFLFGSGASVNTAGFLATTHDIANADFMAGRYNFNIPGRPDASIVNLGRITATDGGFAALVAPGVRNAGVITANLGHVALASGNGFTLDFYGDKLITLQVGDKIASQVIDVATGQPLDALVKNEGKLKANGGQVALTAVAVRHVVDSVINNTGVIEANSVGTRNGMIVLGAATAATKGTDAPTQTVKVSGTLKTKGRHDGEKGGVIKVTGEDIQVAGAKIKASGQAGGGTVLIGASASSSQAGPVPTASSVSIDSASRIDASATLKGDGGHVVVWSTGLTKFDGVIVAKGAGGGNGGFVETSGHALQVTGSVNAGVGGTWLLDPDDLVIDATMATSINASLNGGTNVVETTSAPTAGGLGDISVNAPISWNTSASLTLDAYHAININAPITVAGGGTLNLSAANDATTSQPMLTFGNGSSIQFTSAQQNGSLFINNQVYTLLYSMDDVQNINGKSNSLSGNYALAKPLDAGSRDGWTPIGTNTDGYVLNDGNGFTGTFQGLGNSISNLSVNASYNVGLFGYVGPGGAIANVSLVGGSMSGSGQVGSLAGFNAGVITNVSSSATVSGTDAAGGLVGYNTGTVANAHATGDVVGGNGFDSVGGLVGFNAFSAVVTNSYATGAVSGFYNVGGLVGHNDGTVQYSYATGTVSGGTSQDNYGLGGLVGYNTGTITQSYATGAASGVNSVGGLAGWNSGSIDQSYATGAVNGSTNVGGLVGWNGGSVSQSYANGAVNGSTNVGGLVGWSDGSISQSYANGAVNGSVNVGGLVGFNVEGGEVTNSYATGAVNGNFSVGGLD